MSRKYTASSNPIGSQQSSMQRRSQRSLRRHMLEQANEGLKMQQETIIGLLEKKK